MFMIGFRQKRLCALLVFTIYCFRLSDATSWTVANSPTDKPTCLGSLCERPYVGASIHDQRKRRRKSIWGDSALSSHHISLQSYISERQRLLTIRGGSEVDSDSEDADESEEDGEFASDEESENENDGEETTSEVAVTKEYDEPWVPSPFLNLYASISVMMLARKYDLLNPTMVTIARAAFISYLIILQLFLLYVRIQAKMKNDRTPLEITNPLTSVLQSQIAGNDTGGMLKNLASSFLASKSTVVEYDLKHSRNMQSGLLFNMLFMWFLHFKMGQVQPLFVQAITGLSSIVYSPLFQVYVVGRNLERPFKNPATMSSQKDAAETKSEITGDEDQSVSPENVGEEVAEVEEIVEDNSESDDGDSDDDS